MLKHLARWLRTAGYDALDVLGVDGRTMIALAADENRLLLSCAKSLAEHKSAQGVLFLLPNNELEANALLLRDKMSVDWLYRPLSRCRLCNMELKEACEDDYGKVPPKSSANPGELKKCPRCARLYWPGSHSERMMNTLDLWMQIPSTSAKRELPENSDVA